MKDPLYTRQELVYVILVMVLPIAVAYLWQRDSVPEFILVLGVGMAAGFGVSVAVVRSINRQHAKARDDGDFRA